jgi:hypothetical protein
VRGLFGFAARRVSAGRPTPTPCLCCGGETDGMRAMPGYDALRTACTDRNIEVVESVMGLAGVVDVGKGAVCVGFVADPHGFG